MQILEVLAENGFPVSPYIRSATAQALKNEIDLANRRAASWTF
jgi:hypothetical protein